MITISRKSALQGEAFGARGCGSCTCDPCDCNPCRCGDASIPSWRVTGYHITRGKVHDVDITNLLVLCLAQPLVAGSASEWQEVILIDKKATDEQVRTILSKMDDKLVSMPAEVNVSSSANKAVYRANIAYHTNGDKGQLWVSFVPDEANVVRANEQYVPMSWSYNGPMALRGRF